jgi:transposase
VRVSRLLGLRWMRFDGRLFGGSVAVGKDAVMEVAPRRQEDVSILRHRVRSEPNAKQRDRYRAVLLALEGMSEPEIRIRLGRSRGFIQRWVYAYRDHGLEGIVAKKPPGRLPTLPREEEPALRRILDQPNAPRRGQDVATLLQEQFGATYSVRGALLLLHRLGYEPLKPRPVNPKKDPQAEQQWLESAPLLSRKFDGGILASRSKSGSRTRVDSDRRDA